MSGREVPEVFGTENSTEVAEPRTEIWSERVIGSLLIPICSGSWLV